MTDTTAELRAPTEGKCDPDLMLKMATGTGLTTVTIIGVGPSGFGLFGCLLPPPLLLI